MHLVFLSPLSARLQVQVSKGFASLINDGEVGDPLRNLRLTCFYLPSLSPFLPSLTMIMLGLMTDLN